MNGKRKSGGGEDAAEKDDEDKDLLNNMFSERQVASQSEIKAKLHKLISQKDRLAGEAPGM